jgi:hypothetical protein
MEAPTRSLYSLPLRATHPPHPELWSRSEGRDRHNLTINDWTTLPQLLIVFLLQAGRPLAPTSDEDAM